jgi:hypothetical protein
MGRNATPTNTAPLHTYACPTFLKHKLTEKEDFASVGIVPKLQRISDYLTTPHEN